MIESEALLHYINITIASYWHHIASQASLLDTKNMYKNMEEHTRTLDRAGEEVWPPLCQFQCSLVAGTGLDQKAA